MHLYLPFTLLILFCVFYVIINILEHWPSFLGVLVVCLTFPPHIFFGPIKVWSMLHHGSVGASSE